MSRGGNSMGGGMQSMPDYMQNVHGDWLGEVNGAAAGAADVPIDFTVVDLMNTAFNLATPYQLFEYEDPDSDLDDVDTIIGGLTTALAALDPATDYDTMITKAIAKVAAALETPYPTVQGILATAWQGFSTAAQSDMATVVTNTHIATVLGFIDTWANIVDNSVTKADATLLEADYTLSDDDIDDMVEAQGVKLLPEHRKEMARFSAGMADIGSVNSSAYMMGLALMSSRRLTDMSGFRAELIKYQQDLLQKYQDTRVNFIMELSKLADKIQTEKATVGEKLHDAHEQRRSDFVLKGLTQMVQLMVTQVAARAQLLADGTRVMMEYGRFMEEFRRTIALMTAEAKRLRIVSRQEYLDRELDLDVKHTLWDLNLYQYGSNVLAGIASGGSILPERTSAASSALGGALSGMVMGAPLGTPGAVIGGILGGAAGFLNPE